MNCAAATTEACIYLHSKLLFCKLCYKIEELYLALSTEPAKKTKCKSLRILVSPHPLLFLKKLVDNSIIRIFFSSIFCCFAEFLAASSRSLKVEPTSVPTGAEELGGEEETKNERNKRKQVKKACVNCRKGHRCCEDTRPCKRCSRMGLNCEEGIEDTPTPKKTRTKSHTPVLSTQARPILLHQVHIEPSHSPPVRTPPSAGPTVPWFKRDADPFIPLRYPDLPNIPSPSNTSVDAVSRVAMSLGISTVPPNQLLSQHLQQQQLVQQQQQQQQQQHLRQQQAHFQQHYAASPSHLSSTASSSSPTSAVAGEENENIALTDTVGLSGFLASFLPSQQQQQQQAHINSPHQSSPHSLGSPHQPHMHSASTALLSSGGPLSPASALGFGSVGLPSSSVPLSESLKLVTAPSNPPHNLSHTNNDLSISTLRDSFFNMKDSFLNNRLDPPNLRDSVGKTAPQLHLSNSLGFSAVPGGPLSTSLLVGTSSMPLSVALAPMQNLPQDPPALPENVPSLASTNLTPKDASAAGSTSSTTSRDPPSTSVH